METNINLDSEINEALDLMASNKVKRLIVTDDKKIVGIISLADILTTNLNDEILKTIKSIWKVKDNEKNKDAQIDDFYL